MKTQWTKNGWIVDILYDFAGCFLYAMAILCFSAPNSLAPGGINGIAILVNYLTDFPISVFNFALNIPILLLAWKYLGQTFTLKTMKTVIIMTIMLEVCTFLPAYQGNIIIAGLYTGVLGGVGVALIFMRGSTGGGTDVIIRLIQLRYPYISTGNVMVGLNAVVLAASAVVYGKVESALVALAVLFVQAKVLDGILYGMNMGKVLLIISDQHEAIAARINQELDRGCTLLQGQGSYTHNNRPVLLCAVRKQQLFALKKLVRESDPTAFMLALEASEVIGNGFHTE